MGHMHEAVGSLRQNLDVDWLASYVKNNIENLVFNFLLSFGAIVNFKIMQYSKNCSYFYKFCFGSQTFLSDFTSSITMSALNRNTYYGQFFVWCYIICGNNNPVLVYLLILYFVSSRKQYNQPEHKCLIIFNTYILDYITPRFMSKNALMRV